MKELTFKIIVKKTAQGSFRAVAPTLANCVAEAESEEEAMEELQGTIGEAIREAVKRGEAIEDDSEAQFYNLTIEVQEKEK